MPSIRQFVALVVAAWLGAWLSLHIHVWLKMGLFWASDELDVMGYLLLFTVVVVGVAILPLSLLVERFAPPFLRQLTIILASVIPSAIVATLLLTKFLHRPFTVEQLVFRD